MTLSLLLNIFYQLKEIDVEYKFFHNLVLYFLFLTKLLTVFYRFVKI